MLGASQETSYGRAHYNSPWLLFTDLTLPSMSFNMQAHGSVHAQGEGQLRDFILLQLTCHRHMGAASGSSHVRLQR